MPRAHPPKTIAIIGAGVTGLTAAHELRERGHLVHVLEKSDRPGGAVRSVRRDGYLVEAGPNTMLLGEQSVLDFFRKIGLDDELLEASPSAKNRFIVRGGKPVAVPMGPIDFLRTPLFSGGAKLRLLAEPFIGRAKPEVEESVATFARRRLGSEPVDYAINPLIAGIFAGDPEKLSIRYAFPKLHAFDRDHGSLFFGALAAGRARRRSGQPRFKSRSISFRNGLQAIVDALVRIVGDSLTVRARIESIERSASSRWTVRVSSDGDAPAEITADRVLIATPAYAAASLPINAPGGNPFAPLADVMYPPVSCVALGFQRDHVAHPLDGYGVLVPARENLHILGTLFNSTLFAGRAPNGCVLMTTFVGGMRQPGLATLPEPELRALVLEDLGRLLGVSGEPLFMHVTTWPRAIPQYNLGYGRFHDVMANAEKQFPGLLIGGNTRDGASVGDCIRAGWKLADRADASS